MNRYVSDLTIQRVSALTGLIDGNKIILLVYICTN